MNKHLHFLVLILIFCGNLLFAQKSETKMIDTSLSILKNADSNEKLKILIEFSSYYSDRLPNKSIEYAKEALNLALNSGIPIYQGEAYFLLGYGYYLLNDYDQSLDNFIQCLNVRQKLDDQLGVAACLNKIGNVYQLKRNFPKALLSYQEALRISTLEDLDNEKARSLVNLGTVNQMGGNYKQSIDYFFKALQIQDELEDKEGKAWCYLNIARLFKKTKDFKKALEYLNKSIKLYEELARYDGNTKGITLCLKEIGDIYFHMGEYDNSLLYNHKVLEINKRNGNRFGEAASYSAIGKIYYHLDDYDKGLDYMLRSIQLKQELKDNIDLSSTLRYIGEIYQKKKDLVRATEYYKRSMMVAQSQQLKDDLRDAYLSLSSIYAIMSSHEQSLDYYILYSSLKDSLSSYDIVQRELEYEFSKKQKVLELEQIKQKAKLQRQRLLGIGLGIIVLLLGVVIFLVNKSNKQKQHANKLLKQQNDEISFKNLQIEKQNKEIALQRDSAEHQRDEISRQKEMITSSIEYALRIQKALLPQQRYLDEVLRHYFIYFKPRDIVSGDFYWVSQLGTKTFIAVADCTGHGVPGAFMSMLGVAFLNEIVNKEKNTNPADILNLLRRNIIEALHQSEEDASTKDGMDIAFVVLDNDTRELVYSGANNPLFIVRSGISEEVRGNRMPIGIHRTKTDEPFTAHTIKLNEGDRFYLFSDGFADQFGGERGEKLKRQSFYNLLIEISTFNINDQAIALDKFFENWVGEKHQIDDVLVLGVQL